MRQTKRETKTYDDYIRSSILKNNEFGIEVVDNLEDIISTRFVKDDYETIVGLIRNKEFEKIKTYKPSGYRTGEYITVIKFTDQNEKTYVVTSYDSDELSQDPQVIDIFIA